MGKQAKITAMLLVLALAGSVSAEVITVEVTGVVNYFNTRGGLALDGSVGLGSVITGFTTYDTDTANLGDSITGLYNLISISMTIGSYTFTHDPMSTDYPFFRVYTVDPVYIVGSDAPRFDGTIYIDGSTKTYDDITWSWTYLELFNLWTSSSEYITTVALPDLDSWPELSVFDVRREFRASFYDESNRPFNISGEITSLTVVPEPAMTYYVNATDGNDNNDGLSKETAFATIQKAIDSAYNSDTVLVEDGTYTGPGNRDIDFLGKAITLQSENGPESCIIDCNGIQEDKHRGFYFHSGEQENSVVDGFTITNAYHRYPGGIYCYHSSPTITNCIISGNSAESAGGAIFCYYSNLTITNCTITGNSAYGESGGGGIFCFFSSPIITNCSISGNTADGFGGAISLRDGSNPTITNCTISGNSAEDGGAISCVGGSEGRSSPVITNCTITGNRADDGGGIYFRYSNPTINNCTFAKNSASNGNALAFDSYLQHYPSTVQLTNCILRDSGDEIWNNDDSTISINYSDVQGGYTGEGNIDADPCFVEPGYWADANDPNIIVEPNDPNAIWIDGDYHLQSFGWRWDTQRKIWTWDDVTSRCIDAGNPGSPLGEELLSVPVDPNNEWGQNLRINMGAFGGTSEASMPPYNWALLGDLTNDGIDNLKDYTAQAQYWMITESEQPGDLNRDGTVDIADLALLTEDWLEQTSWYVP